MNIEVTPELLRQLTETERAGLHRAMAIESERLAAEAEQARQPPPGPGAIVQNGEEVSQQLHDLYAPVCTPWTPRSQ